jgi:Cu/Ag efflux protein CusF
MTKSIILAGLVCVAGATLAYAQAQAPAKAPAQAPAKGTVSRVSSVTATATIQAIDSTTRQITLRNEKGEEDTFVVGPDVTRFNELKVGDKVKFTYYESLVFQVRKPGEASDAAADNAAFARAKGELPGAALAHQQKTTVTVKAIDPAVPSITVTTADGRTVTRKIEDKKNLEGVKVGDRIDITYTEAIATSVERAQ